MNDAEYLKVARKNWNGRIAKPEHLDAIRYGLAHEEIETRLDASSIVFRGRGALLERLHASARANISSFIETEETHRGPSYLLLSLSALFALKEMPAEQLCLDIFVKYLVKTAKDSGAKSVMRCVALNCLLRLARRGKLPLAELVIKELREDPDPKVSGNAATYASMLDSK